MKATPDGGVSLCLPQNSSSQFSVQCFHRYSAPAKSTHMAGKTTKYRFGGFSANVGWSIPRAFDLHMGVAAELRDESASGGGTHMEPLSQRFC